MSTQEVVEKLGEPEIEQAVRAVKHYSGGTGVKLHVPDSEGKAMCHIGGRNDVDFRPVDVINFPGVWRDWCIPCVQIYWGKPTGVDSWGKRDD